MVEFIDNLLKWYDSIWGFEGEVKGFVQTVDAFLTADVVTSYYNDQSPAVQQDPRVIAAYEKRLAEVAGTKSGLRDPFAKFIEGALGKWLDAIQGLENLSPEESKTKLSEITAKILEMTAVSATIDLGLGMLPNSAGTASSANTKQLLTWLGFGAVIAAVAHDPVKIGLLRPYQDNLEATFRNKRFDHIETLNAYRQRSLSTIPVPEIDMITDEIMDEIETDNNVNLFSFMAKHGYKDDYIKIMQDASTRALSFGNLSAMAKMGHYNRQEAIFSLWTFGIDRRIMRSSLAALETMRDVGLWKGFRSMVEPGYVQGLIEAEDVREYWTRILVPDQVQDWAMIRLTKSREKFLAKEALQLNVQGRDLTKADWTTAFVLGNIDQAAFESKLHTLGYDDDEVAVLVANAKSRIKTDKAATCKRLPLSDYELAHRNSILTLQQVLDRMQGEYCQADIDLESQLLQIDDLTTDAPARERDLAASTIMTAFVEGVRNQGQTNAYLIKLGYDKQEIDTLFGIAEIKKENYDAKKARDDALAEAKAAKDALAEARAGLKRLPLSDYEKAWQYNLISEQDVLDRMKNEYNDYDIGLEKLMLAAGIARKG